MITRLKITNYRGIAAFDVAPPAGGAIAKGRNGSGKTTMLRAIRAALAGSDISPDAIRRGEDSAEIVIDLDDVSVRRRITRAGTPSLKVTREGFVAPKPQAFLSYLLGSSPLDPLDLMLLRAKDRRARILEALPCAVTREQLLAWAPSLPPSFDCSGHGLEVVERAKCYYYDLRTAANATAKASATAAISAETALGGACAPEGGPTVEQATADRDRASREAERLRLRQDEARKHEARTADLRDEIVAKRKRARLALAEVPDIIDEAPLLAAEGELCVMVLDLERQLADARGKWSAAAVEVGAARASNARRDAMGANIERELALADQFESSIAQGPQAPTEAEVGAAREAERNASLALAQANTHESLRRQMAEAERLRTQADRDAATAAELDGVVRALQNDAPAQLLAASNSIPGLQLDGDNVILDGVKLDALCGAEQMKLCVDIAKRSNGKAKFLVVDGLERLDPEQLAAFEAEATSGGWQLFATCVASGPLSLQPIEGEVADAPNA